MSKLKFTKWLSAVLAVVMLLSVVPFNALAALDSEWIEFLDALKVLEGYAQDYAEMNSEEDVDELVINYIRTGVERYATSEWDIMAGTEITGFTTYVKNQDAATGTNVESLRDIYKIRVPNGQEIEFSHLFGALNIAYYCNGSTNNSDFGSWAGDLVDLMEFSDKTMTATTLEGMIEEIRENYFGTDVDIPGIGGFGKDDVYADLDAYYFQIKLRSTNKSLSQLMETYYSANLTDVNRAAYFLRNRFSGKTSREEIRAAVLEAYKANSGCSVLEADRGLSGKKDLRIACCYVFADYLYDLAKDELPAPNTYYEVFSSELSTLAPGVTQQINYAMTADNKQIVYYIATADINRGDVHVFANYNNNDASEWEMSRVTDQIAAAQNKYSDPNSPHYIKNYNVVAGVNGDFFNMTTGEPSGALVMNGVTYHPNKNRNFFAILKDGTPVIGTGADWSKYEGQVQEALGSDAILIKDGKIVEMTSGSYLNSRHSRTCVGITEDGQVVLMTLDGRQEPFSAGGSLREIAQIMLEAGCVSAVNLDGGGSSTFAAKQEGADSVTVINSPSDGYERSVSSSLMIVSTAETSTAFDHALISSEYSYLTPGTKLPMTAVGVSLSGNNADVPANAVWASADESVAIVDGFGVVTAVSAGDVEIQLLVDGKVVGKKILHVIFVPDALEFTKLSMNAVFGTPAQLPLKASYNGNPVAINPSDVGFEHSAGTGVTFIDFAVLCGEESGIRQLMVYVYLENDISIDALMVLTMFKPGEATFDFDNCTSGDRQFAYDRVVSNSVTEDTYYYQVVDPSNPMEIDYTFGLDMEAITMPENLKPLLSLVAGGDQGDITAWQLLLQLAERINPMSNVKVTMQVDPNITFDVTNLTLVNELFTLTGKEYDPENNTLTLTFNFIKQSKALDSMAVNSICIVSGIKAYVKNEAAWENDRLNIMNTGSVRYKMYLRASAAYSYANNPEYQEQFGIQPFVDTVINPTYNAPDRGASFEYTYTTFADSFVLDRAIREGWQTEGDNQYYYKDNEIVTGIHLVPGFEDPNSMYFYNFGEDGICKGKVSGLIYLGNDIYYAIAGVKQTGWMSLKSETKENEKDYYYFDLKTGKAVNGKQRIDGYSFEFTDYILTKGELVVTSTGKMHYRWGNGWIMRKWVEVDGKWYYATYDKVGLGYFATDILNTPVVGDIDTYYYHVFGDDCSWDSDYNGLYTDKSGHIYLIENGLAMKDPGLVEIDGDYYYFDEWSRAFRNTNRWVTKTNGLLPEGMYKFGNDGKIIFPEPVVYPDGLNWIDGKLFYYKDNQLQKNVGLIEIDGAYYYFRTYGDFSAMVSGQKWVTKAEANGLVDGDQMYKFGADGKMIVPEPVVYPDGLNWIDGKLYYYLNNELQKNLGLIEIDGGLYYFRTYGDHSAMVSGQKWVTKAEANGLVDGDEMYKFGADGKMIVPEPVVYPDGLNWIDGKLFYYKDNKVQKNIGMIEIDGGLYYFRTYGDGSAMVNGQKWVTKAEANGLVDGDEMYKFGADGKLIVPEPVVYPDGLNWINGKLYYYLDNKLQENVGLIKIGEDYYYFRTYGDHSAMVSGQKWITKEEAHGYVPGDAMYRFDENGKLIQK